MVGVVIIFLWTGCKRDATDGSLRITLSEQAGTAALRFDTFAYEAKAGHSYSVITLKYYLSRIRLLSSAGTQFDLTDVIYRDARDPESGDILITRIPNGTYSQLECVFGLDAAMNVDGGLENTLQNINMEWPIPGDEGYHYMKFEGKYHVYQSDTIRSFNLHLGATGGNQNYFNLSIPLPPLVINGDDWDVLLSMDVNEWLQNPTTYDFEMYGPAIMMNQTAQEILKVNGATVFSLNSIKRSN